MRHRDLRRLVERDAVERRPLEARGAEERRARDQAPSRAGGRPRELRRTAGQPDPEQLQLLALVGARADANDRHAPSGASHERRRVLQHVVDGAVREGRDQHALAAESPGGQEQRQEPGLAGTGRPLHELERLCAPGRGVGLGLCRAQREAARGEPFQRVECGGLAGGVGSRLQATGEQVAQRALPRRGRGVGAMDRAQQRVGQVGVAAVEDQRRLAPHEAVERLAVAAPRDRQRQPSLGRVEVDELDRQGVPRVVAAAEPQPVGEAEAGAVARRAERQPSRARFPPGERQPVDRVAGLDPARDRQAVQLVEVAARRRPLAEHGAQQPVAPRGVGSGCRSGRRAHRRTIHAATRASRARRRAPSSVSASRHGPGTPSRRNAA